MKIGICQINPTVGDFAGNLRRIEECCSEAKRAGAELAVFPELTICGYPPEDLLLRPGFLAAHDEALQKLAANLPPDLPTLVGCLAANEDAAKGGRALFNAVALIEDGIFRI
ncbi:MAG: nitrilase-related carbon-nitrogen hydrolase, partial [Planctomycetota bacterium]